MSATRYEQTWGLSAPSMTASADTRKHERCLPGRPTFLDGYRVSILPCLTDVDDARCVRAAALPSVMTPLGCGSKESTSTSFFGRMGTNV